MLDSAAAIRRVEPACNPSGITWSRQKSQVELAVVIPTLNESENVFGLVRGLERALRGIEWEAIFVDDASCDGTAEIVRLIAAGDRRVRILERIRRRGLASACIDGMLATSAPFIAVMDGDLQHDETILPEMLNRIRSKELDIVVGSRIIAGGSFGSMPPWRLLLSRLGTRVSHLICPIDICDPMSGFFLIRRTFFQTLVRRLHGRGFKILVDILASSVTAVRLDEVPYHFRKRTRGKSKLDISVEIAYLQLVIAKIARKIVSGFFLLLLCSPSTSFSIVDF